MPTIIMLQHHGLPESYQVPDVHPVLKLKKHKISNRKYNTSKSVGTNHGRSTQAGMGVENYTVLFHSHISHVLVLTVPVVETVWF